LVYVLSRWCGSNTRCLVHGSHVTHLTNSSSSLLHGRTALASRNCEWVLHYLIDTYKCNTVLGECYLFVGWLCNTRSVISHPLGPIPGARSVWYMQVTTVIDMLATGCISRGLKNVLSPAIPPNTCNFGSNFSLQGI
jgi:hypothetical protein